jgi:HK97 gp10 family phage protein
MGKFMDIEVKGLQKLEKKLSKLPEKVAKKVVSKAVRAGAKPMLAQARANAPVKTGLTKKSIKIRTMKAKWAKPGYGVHIGVSDKWFSGEAFYAGMVEFGTVRMAAQPFIRPAYDVTKDESVRITAKALRDGVENAAKG